MGEVLKKFGRYFLLDHIAQGGMAEIYRARLASVDGAGRLMVIKKIQAGYGANVEFLQMFKSEIKVTMGFNHPNIVQLYDFGEENSQPYIAMEWVDGKSLRQFGTRFAELKLTFPVELAAFITEQAASGLHYAHSFKDKITGAPLNIVHRDISPQNILISFEGSVKVIDFGIAKATVNSESTRAGVIKGKPSYLSPEQISGEVLDGRSDIFALGAVLWELLTGKKLFAGENDLAVLKLIESAQTHVKPPSTLNPKVPKELDYIVLKSLTKQREKRYQSAEELQRALHKFLYAYMPEFNPSDLAYYAKDLFKNEIVEDRKKIQKLNDKVEQLLSNQQFEEESTPSETQAPQKKEDTTTVIDNRLRSASSGGRDVFKGNALKETKIEIDSASMTATKVAQMEKHRSNLEAAKKTQTSTGTYAPQQRKVAADSSSPMGKLILLGVIALLGVAIFGPDFGIQVPVLSPMIEDWLGGTEARVTLLGNQKNVTVAVNGQTVATALPATLNGIPVGTSVRITVTGTQGGFQQDVTLRKGEKKQISVVLTEKVTNSSISSTNSVVSPGLDKSIMLRINVTPAGRSLVISVNGKSVDISNPVVPVPLDAPLELTVERPDYKPFKREFVLESKQVNGLKEWLMDVQMEPSKYGFLTIHTTPSADAMIMIDGAPWKRKTPIENEKLPVGSYSIHLVNDVLGMEKNVNISIQEGKSFNIDERLEIKN